MAAALAFAVFVYAFVYGSKVAGGSDSYGYLSEAELWLSGSLHVDQPFAKDVPWPNGAATFLPLGYRPGPQPGASDIVPAYAPGLPLLLAAAKRVGGETGKFLVVPLCSAILVLATYRLGRQLASPAAGVVAAWLVATSPVVLLMAVQVMSDLPAGAAWAASLTLALGSSAAAAFGSGVAAGAAILIRPNLAFVAPIIGLRYLMGAVDRETRRRFMVGAVLFSIGAAAGGAIDAIVNGNLYGSPYVSGYGSLDEMFRPERILPNVTRYFSWVTTSQTPLVLVGMAALWIPSRRLWPLAKPPGLVLIGAVAVLAIWLSYLLWLVFDAWWYLRFLVPALPLMSVGAGALAAALWRARFPALRVAVVLVVVAAGLFAFRRAGDFAVFDTWAEERQYIRVARMVSDLTPPNAVILSMQHSGSVRYYAGRMTARYDAIDRDHIDDAVAWMTAHGADVYLLVDGTETTMVRDRFAGTRTAQAFERVPRGLYQDSGSAYLYDLSHPERIVAPGLYAGVDRGVSVPGPVPPPHVTFHP